jgi:hypothetical protein
MIIISSGVATLSAAEKRNVIILNKILKACYDQYLHCPVPMRQIMDKPIFMLIRLYKHFFGTIH